MNLLIEGIEQKAVIKTDTNKKLVIDNHSQVYPVFKIKLDYLYYNDQNDRIATWVSRYKIDNNVKEIDMSDKEKYNEIVHNFITQSNRESLKQTQKNIKIFGQQEVGVVLSDGRIVDGNRRFTCLRNIEKEEGKTQYFEAVILDHNIKNNAKQIKMLELMLQHGVDEKVGYNPIDRLVGIYNDILESKLLTEKEYASIVNQKESEIKFEVEKAKLMVEFLEFINAPKQFHIARDFNLSDPLRELNMMLRSINDEDLKEDLKNVVFSQFLIQPFADTTRYMRRIKKIVNNKKFINDYIEDLSESVNRICDELEKYPKLSNTEINKIREKEDIKQDFFYCTEKYMNKACGEETRNQPGKQVEKAFDCLDLIDYNIFSKMTLQQKNDIKEKLDMLNNMVLEIRSKLDV